MQPDEVDTLRRIKGNIDNILENRKEDLNDKVNRVSTPPRTARQRSKSNKGERRGKGTGKGEGKGDQDAPECGKARLMEARSKASAPEARSKAGPPIGSCAGSSTPVRQGVKRSAGAPASPESIERLAATYWQCYGAKMRKHDVENFPKTLRIIIKDCILC